MIQDYLESLPEAVLARLFRSPASVLATLRLLPPLAKHLVLQMAFTPDQPVPLRALDRWIRPDAHKRSGGRVEAEALQALRSLHVVRELYAQQAIQINAMFARSLRAALQNTDTTGSIVAANAPPLPTKYLAEYAQRKWDSILHFMVASTTHLPLDSEPPTQDILDLLRSSGLMVGPTPTRSHITSQGFQFLLQSRASQVWSLLLHYLGGAGRDPVEVLDLVFTLGTLELGAAYEVPSTYSRIVTDLADLGIVYVRGNNFYPALSIATTTATQNAPPSTLADSTGFIILETNYRLYAYTDSPLQISVLNLFCRLHSRFPNLVVGRLTRESVRRALHNGITADQLIQFLTAHAHPEMKAKGGLPPTIADQIRLWQLELDRFRAVDGYLFRDFTGAREYTSVVAFAQDIGAVLWRNDRRRMFFTDAGSAQQILEFVNRQLKSESQTESTGPM